METNALIRYSGYALEDGKMDVYRASENMIAFSEFMDAAVKVAYGNAAEAKTEVSGFKHGSFTTSMVVTVAGQAATIFTSLSPDQLWSVVKGAFDLWKFLKGLAPKSVQNNGNTCTVTNNYGEVIQIKTESFNLVMNEKASESVARYIGRGLAPDGFESLEIVGNNGQSTLTVSKAESIGFKKVTSENIVSDNESRMIVHIVAAVFQDGNKWRLSDGERTFSAAILDGNFLATVDGGARFGKGDVLDVDMRIVQNLDGMKTSIERFILKVHRHLTPQEQQQLI